MILKQKVHICICMGDDLTSHLTQKCGGWGKDGPKRKI